MLVVVLLLLLLLVCCCCGGGNVGVNNIYLFIIFFLGLNAVHVKEQKAIIDEALS